VNAKNTKWISPKAGVRSSGVQSKASGKFEFNHHHHYHHHHHHHLLLLRPLLSPPGMRFAVHCVTDPRPCRLSILGVLPDY